MKLYLPWQIIRPVTATAYELRTINWPVIYIIGFLAACMNIMLIHSYIPADATQTVICPTVTRIKMVIYLIALIIGLLH